MNPLSFDALAAYWSAPEIATNFIIFFNVLDAQSIMDTAVTIGLVVIPLYSSFNALAIGALALADPIERKVTSDWIAAGISPSQLAKELLCFRLVRYIPSLLVYLTILFFGLFCILASDPYGSTPDGVTIATIAVAFILMQGLFFSASALVATFAGTLAGRFFAVFGYYILHNTLPLIGLVLFETYYQHSGSSKTAEYVSIALHPYGFFIGSLAQIENSGVGDESLSYFLAAFSGQVLMIALFASLAVRRFVRIVMR